MTREEKIGKIREIISDELHYAYLESRLTETSNKIVDALTEPNVEVYGKFWDVDENECVYTKLKSTDESRYPYRTSFGDFRHFKLIPGLKELLEEAER